MARAPSGRPLRHLYKTARWERVRCEQLSRQPLCERCLSQEIVELATVVHHKVAHRGALGLFWDGPFESLCKSHHDRDGQLEDHGKTVIRFGPDGWPI